MPLIYNPRTRTYLDALQKQTPHALLLTGEAGSGLASTAREIAGRALAEIITPGAETGKTTSIRVEQIRALYDATKGKTATARVFLIDDADRMTETAQNAFLKLLEEPTPNVRFILTTHAPDKLLPTIRSRVQMLPIRPITNAQTDSMLQKVTDPRKAAQIRFLAAGKPAEITRLMTDEAYFAAQSQLVRDAQKYIGGERYERIRQAFAYAGNRENALSMLAAAKTVMTHTIKTNPTRESILRADRLRETIEHLEQNGNVRLQLLRFVV